VPKVWRKYESPGTKLGTASSVALALQSDGKFAHGQVHRYVVRLPDDATAVLNLEAGKGWRLTIQNSAQVVDRGLFATTYDAMALLTAEYESPAHLPK
jgi:hypothetical protein